MAGFEVTTEVRRQRGTIARGGAERMIPKADAPPQLPSSKFARTKS